MKPEKRLVSIKDNQAQIKQLLSELVLAPRLNAIRWAAITKQTPNIKIGYPGQHLASLITGIEGERTGARGNDLRDGSEVKSCSRIDQLDACNNCKAPVSRIETECAECNSTDILRKDDSKWLFSIRSEADLDVLINKVPRVLLMIGDYPGFIDKDFNTLRFQAYEIWPQEERHKNFRLLMTNYYQNIYLAHKEKSPTKNPAPKNFWPDSYQFYMTNPVRVFSCTVKNANTNPVITIDSLINPEQDRSELPSLVMPAALLNPEEIELIFTNVPENILQKNLSEEAREKNLNELRSLSVVQKRTALAGADESLRAYLPLRKDRTASAKAQYARRATK